MTFTEKLKELHACEDAVEWAEGKTWQEVYQTCERGDWLAWLFVHLHPEDKRRYIIAGKFALAVKHLMKDERSVKACETAIAHGRGEASEEELRVASGAAMDAARDAVGDAARAAAWAARGAAWAEGEAAAWDAMEAAAWAARETAWPAAMDAAMEAAMEAAMDAARVAKADVLKQCADIIREELPIEEWGLDTLN